MTLKKTLFALMAILALAGCGDSTKTSSPALDDFGVRFAQAFMYSNMQSALQGWKAPFEKEEALAMLGVQNVVTSQTLSKAYKENEVAADEKYKGQRVLVSGRVKGVNKDISGAPFVSLPGASMFEDVSARFPRDSVSELAKYKKGMNVKLVCEVSGLTLLNVSLKDCTSLDDYLAAQQEKINSEVKRFAAGEKAKPTQQKKSRLANMVDGDRIENEKFAKVSYWLYLSALQIPSDSECRQSGNNCIEAFGKLSQDAKQKVNEQFFLLYPEGMK